MADKRYFTEMDEPFTPPPWEPRPPGFGGRLKALLARARAGLQAFGSRVGARFRTLGARLRPSEWVPSRGAWLLFGLWILLALMTSQVLGAFLTGTFEAPWQVFAVTFGLTFGLPLLLAPRPTREPLGWGIGLNVLALTALALLARPTSKALGSHGHWEVDWLEERDSGEVAIGLARMMASFTRWGVAQVPVEQLEAQFGDLKDQAGAPAGLQQEQAIEVAKAKREGTSRTHPRPGGPPDDDLPGGSVRAEGAPEDAAPGSASAITIPGTDAKPDLEPRDALKAKIDDARVLANPDDPYWSDLARSPSTATVGKQEKRLLELVNLERTRQGLSSLPLRADLCRLARAHSESMSSGKYLNHTNPQGQGPKDRARAMLKEDWNVEEAIAKTPQAGDTSRDLLNIMLRTPDERGVILDDETSYRGIGTGMACDGPTCYATVLFLR